MATQNEALLEIAGVLEAMRSAIINGDGVSYNQMEVFLAAMQAVIEILCGGSPSSIILPQILQGAGLDDTAVARFCNGTIPATPYFPPSNPNAASQESVAADGSEAVPISFATPLASEIVTVLYSISNYSGSDNASLSARLTAMSLDGFSIIVSGGQGGSTCTVGYVPVGT